MRCTHLIALDRGTSTTPFPAPEVMFRAASPAEVDRHTEVFGEAVERLCG